MYVRACPRSVGRTLPLKDIYKDNICGVTYINVSNFNISEYRILCES